MPESSDGFWGRTAASFVGNTYGPLSSLLRGTTKFLQTVAGGQPPGDAATAAAYRAFQPPPDYVGPPTTATGGFGTVLGTLLGVAADSYLLGGGADDVDVAGDGTGVKSKFLDTPADSGGTLNIGAGERPLEGAYNIDINPSADGVYQGNINNLSNIKTGSQSNVIIDNPYNYNPLGSEVSRVLESGGTVQISGGMSNKFFNQVYNMTAEDLRAAGYNLVWKGPFADAPVAYTTSGEVIQGTAMKIVLTKI